MMTSPPMSIVPQCPQGLTISRDDFLSPNFSVDAFLLHWNTALTSSAAATGRPRSLETLRDDLGIYLKVLRSSMIELINEDYADFVNLSTNLVDLDKGISLLEDPLTKYKKEVLEVRQALDGTINVLQDKLNHRKSLYAKKIALQNLEHITSTLNKVERIIHQGKESGKMSGDLVERVATEINHLNFCVSKCDSAAFIEELQPRLKAIGDHLQVSLESQMISALQEKNHEVLRRCLRIFVTVDKARDAENLVRSKIVKPYLTSIITEPVLSSKGLAKLYELVLEVVPLHLDTLLKIIGTKRSPDFNFLVNSVWPEFLDQIDDNLSFIFSAGNPDKFLSNYQCSMDFLDKFERELKDLESIEYFRATEQYQSFLNKWNLPVYFQIRFQEIALPVENCVQSMFLQDKQLEPLNFQLKATKVAVRSIEKCWDDSVFFPALCHRFWKLTLQIIARYGHAVKLAPEQDMPEEDSGVLKPSATTLNLQDKHQPPGHKRSSSDTTSEQLIVKETKKYRSSCFHLISLYSDLTLFVQELRNRILPNVIISKMGEMTESQDQAVNIGLEEGCQSLLDQLPFLSQIIVNNVLDKSLPCLKQVTDIPRLYRRTNREVPSKPCTYMINVLLPISGFHSEHEKHSPSGAMNIWLQQILQKVVEVFLSNVKEVLAAVQKMEESLRRLKKVRDNKTASAATDGNKPTISDDDKIRLQLYLDVKHLKKQIEFQFKVEVKQLEELELLVNEATINMESFRVD